MSTRFEGDPSSLDGSFMSEKDYLALPETTRRMELVDGMVVCEPSSSDAHQVLVMSTYDQLREWARGRSPEPSLRIAPLDVRFGLERILQPDVFVFVRPLQRPVTMPIRRVPDICIEVVSTPHVYDRITKRQIYAVAGVAELWTVLEKPRMVERWTGPGLSTREESRQALEAPVLPGFVLDVARLFES